MCKLTLAGTWLASLTLSFQPPNKTDGPIQEEILVDFQSPTVEALEPGTMTQQRQPDKGCVVKATTPFSHTLDDVEGFKNPHRQLQLMGMTAVDHLEECGEVDPQTG